MRGKSTWSYRPYRPFLTEVGEVYICRLVPREHGIRVEWLSLSGGEYAVYLRKRGEGEFARVCDTCECACEITGLTADTDYELYVAKDEKRSRVRLVRCGKVVGEVVNYLHPEDDAYLFSGRYLASPSLVRHPDGYLLASMDVFAGGHPQNFSLIFRSDDDGESWHYVSELMPCFWGKLFIHKGELYMLSVATEYGDLLIGKSTDGGKTFSAPVTLLRGSNGKAANSGVHKNPQPIFCHNGRIYETLEWGAWANREGYGHAAMVMSCDENDDLLVPENWSFSEPVAFSAFTPEIADLPVDTMMIEGTLTLSPEGELLNIMRFGKYHKAIVFRVNTEDHEAPLAFSRLMDFPANYTKFMIKLDSVSGYYYTVGTRVYDPEHPHARNLLSILRSRDLVSWEVVSDVLDYRDGDFHLIGFQYADFSIEGDDIIFLLRTAMNGAANYHDSNTITFHRIKNFRDLGA